MRLLRTVTSLAVLSAREWIRLKFFHIIAFFGLLFIAFSYLLSSLTFSVQERLFYDFGLGSLELGLIMIASLIGSHTIQREVDRKTMFVILARPITRASVVLGAWGAIVILCVLFLLGFVASVAVTVPGQLPVAGVAIAALSSIEKAMIVASVAIAFGLMVRPLLALVASISYWILCYSIADVDFFVNRLELESVRSIYSVVKRFLPEFYNYNWKSFYYVQNLPNNQEIIWTVLHSLSWVCIWLFIGAIVFRRKEIV